MRLSKSLHGQRVNADLQFRFEAPGLTSFAGLELVRMYFARSGVLSRIKTLLGRSLPASDFGVVRMVLLVLALIITGGRRLRHLMYLTGDPVVRRFCGLAHVPADRTLGRWLASFDATHVQCVQKLNQEVAANTIRGLGLKRLTLDVDGSVISTGLKVEGARRGFNPHHRKVPSYYPITAYEAQSGQILRAQNRPGNIHDGKASIDFLGALIDQAQQDLPGAKLECRMDSAFFLEEIFALLDARKVDYAVKVPFWRWLDLQQPIRACKYWQRVDDSVSCFVHLQLVEPWKRYLHVVIYRKRVHHESRKNFQLDLFDPDDGHYEYSAIATNTSLGGHALWHFMCGRGAHEKAYAELKNGFAFDSVPSMSYHANCAWQLFSVLAFNLTRALQTQLVSDLRPRTLKRRTLVALKSIQTLRFEWLNRAGVLVHPDGKATLDVGNIKTVRQHFEGIHQALALVA